jgi:DNA-binding MarR family transcriptional regulator
MEQSSEATQRQIASQTGISLGLVNAIVKDLGKRGMIKIRQVPRRRLLYYLTPQGFSEKTALLLRVLRTVQGDYQQIRVQLHRQASKMKQEGVSELSICGDPFLLEIGCLCCLELGITVKGLFSDNVHRVGDNLCGHILRAADEPKNGDTIWNVDFSSLGLVRDHVVERSRIPSESKFNGETASP